jgi:hypothetical protein
VAGLFWTAGVLGLLFFLLVDANSALHKFRQRVSKRGLTLDGFSSSFWLTLIFIGAVFAAIGAFLIATANVNYNVARDREKGEKASAKAMGMLRSEIERNLNRILTIRNLQAGSIATSSLETTAWNVVSTGGLLVQMDQDTLGKVTDAYHLLGQAEAYRSEIVNRKIGIAAAIGGSDAITQQYIGHFNRTLDELEPKLRSLVELPSDSTILQTRK